MSAIAIIASLHLLLGQIQVCRTWNRNQCHPSCVPRVADTMIMDDLASDVVTGRKKARRWTLSLAKQTTVICSVHGDVLNAD
jgi:hypothetical protein